MDKERLGKFIGKNTISIVDAMEKIDGNSGGILYVVNESGILEGCITDGDIRRWLIKSADLKASVKSAMTTSPSYIFEEERIKAESIMKRKVITSLPILNDACQVVDIVLLSEISDFRIKKKKNDLSGVPVVVMAGGKGTRLYPYTKILPKPLIPIGETPIIERILNCYREYGIKRFHMTVNYKKNMMKSYFADSKPDYEIIYVDEDKPLGTGGSIRLINEKFDRPLFVTNCDALILTDYAELYDYHIKSNNTVTIVGALKNITVPYGVLHSGDNGELMSVEEKPKLSYFINSGMYVINPETIDLIPDGETYHMTYLVEDVLKSGGKVGMYPISEDSFLDMGEFSEMKRMEEKLHIVSEEK